ncbi:MAG: TIR domain-containing protein, partial [Desulfobacterales bacterium]
MSVSSFLENDIFMSYAHLDNETLTEDEKGWVSAFDNALQKRVSQLIGRKADIWRDRKLHGNDIFGDEIVDQFPKLKVFVSIVSPRYLKSEWCLKELKEFHKVANKTGGVRLGNKSRIFKVIKTPVPPDEY